jgi:alkanesulfonate monooxygenase SsuD/methylene tetrahydromethanopterin reductase-like flavin-dependent oxidoreductase (luciferase family)
MDIGLIVDFRNPPEWQQRWAEHYARTLELIEESDRLGAPAIFLTEHHLSEDGYLPQPLTMAAAVAMRTRRARIGTAVLLAPLRHPLHMAEEAAIVDLLSGGRLELGVGTGYRDAEFVAFGTDSRSKHAILTDQVRELRRLLSPDSEMMPHPVQQQVPLWVGYNGAVGARRAGRLGEGLLSSRRELLEPYQQGLADGGYDPASGRMCGLVNLVVAADPEATWAKIERHVRYQLGSYVDFRGERTDSFGDGAPTLTDLKRGTARVGEYKVLDPEDAITYVREQSAGLPITHLLTWLTIANMPEEVTVEHLELLFGRVAPAVTTTDRSSL